MRTFNRGVPNHRLHEALRFLTDDEQRLFARLQPVDQRHSLQMFEAARAMQPNDRVLWVAALLHDVGKGQPRRLDRVMLTLLETVAPWRLIRGQRLPRNSWRGVIARLAAHTEGSARFAELAGSDAEVVVTIRSYGHRDDARGKRLAELDAVL